MPKKRTPKSAKKECWRIASLIVRSIGYYERCGKSDNLQGSHWIPRRYGNTFTDFDNIFSLCYACHIHWWHKDIGAAHEWAIEQRGEATYRRLREAANQTSKVDWLEELERLREIAKREDVSV